MLCFLLKHDEFGLLGINLFQAIAIASCFANEGPMLVVCPAILRYTWAEELERWLPSYLPADIHLGIVSRFFALRHWCIHFWCFFLGGGGLYRPIQPQDIHFHLLMLVTLK